MFESLLTFPNVLITRDRALFTVDAFMSIARTTRANISTFEQGKPCPNQIKLEALKAIGSSV